MKMSAIVEAVIRAFASPRIPLPPRDWRVRAADEQQENARNEYRESTNAVHETAERACRKVANGGNDPSLS